MKHNMNKIRRGIISAIILIVCITTVSATPPIPESYWGYATLNGAPVPYGTSITVEVYDTGEVVGSTTVQDPNGGYSLEVGFDDSDTPEDEGANEGDQLTWKINGIECSTPTPGTDTATPGRLSSNFNLAATSADTPPSVTILHPNGGESISRGTQVQVSARATDDTAVTSVTFSYSNNGGSDWISIGTGTRVSGTAKDGIWNRTWNTNGLGAGSNYLIKAIASDSTLTREDQSDSTFLLTCTPPSAPALNNPGITDTDGSYTVSWSSVSGATSYTLEEDTSGSFGSPIVVYSGSGTSTQITGRSNGTYYYRVNACNACGCGGWSNVEGIEISGGDVPLLDITHAMHPCTVYNYQRFYPNLQVLTLSFKEIHVNKTFHDVNGSVKVGFNLDEDITVLGFEVKYIGQGGHLGVNIGLPDGTNEELFDDTIYNGNSWQFHYHDASAGNWTLSIVTTESANITVILGECEAPFKMSDLKEKSFVILCSSYQNYTTKERETIHEYVSAGGSLLISGESGGSIWGENLNQLIKPFGIELNGGLRDPTNNRGVDFQPILHNFTNHSIALRAKELRVDEIQVLAGGALEISNSDAKVVLCGDADTTALPTYPEGSYPPFAATLTYKKGKIFIQGDSSPGPKEWYQAISEWYQGKPPVADFTYSSENTFVNQTITFNASSSYDPDGNITDYKWCFGDGNTINTTEPVLTHSYICAGNYTVMLTVLDNTGATDTETKTIIVGVKGDLNSDGILTPADAAIALRIAASGAHDDAADVSGDGRVTPLDALMILQAAVGNIEIS